MPVPWIEPSEVDIPESLQQEVGGHPLVAQTLVRRGISDPNRARSFLDPQYYQPSLPSELPGLSQAADRLEIAIQNNETILVWGDFDVDGQTATTLLVEALHHLGARVRFHIPVRASEGHGIQPEVLATFLQSTDQGAGHTSEPDPSLLLTCDTGITAHAAVEYANSQGITVIITDHHEPAQTLPPAFAIINPHLLPTLQHPLSSLPGVGVAYLLIHELYLRQGQPQSVQHYLDLVALGIVVDVAEQRGDTRYLLQLGLNVLRTTPRLGLQALYQIAGLNPAHLDEGHVGFTIGPRLNALGRLSDANPIVEFLTTTDPTRAEILAIQIDGFNQRRRILTDQVHQGALAQIERQPELLNYSALVLSHPGWPAGILGLVASRLAEDYRKPTILLGIDDKGMAAGSARSIPGIHITDAIKRQADLLFGFGGHAGAAGLSLTRENIPDFRTRLSRTIRSTIPAENLQPGLAIDAYLSLDQINLDLVDEIRRIAPFGQGNPPLVLAARQVQIESTTEIGRNQEHRRLVISDPLGNIQEILWWRSNHIPLPPKNISIDLALKASANTFRGERRLQLEWVDFHLPDGLPIRMERAPQETIHIYDHRQEEHPTAILSTLAGEKSLQIWEEGQENPAVESRDRLKLAPRPSLVIWTTPPGPRVLEKVLEQVKPERIYWFANDPNLDSLQPFLTRLAGLVKHAIHRKEGRITINELAAAVAHNVGTVHLGLLWLQANGSIHLDTPEEGRFLIEPGSGEKDNELPAITYELKGLLEETAEFRRYLTHASKETLVGFLPKNDDN